MRKLNPTLIALIGGIVIVLLLVAYFATNRNADQDKLTGNELGQTIAPAQPGRECASSATYNLIKKELFLSAAQHRGSDQATFEEVAGFAVVRMDNAVMESEDESSGTIDCSGLLSLDLPPGIALADGRRNLMSNIDYSIQPNGAVVLRNANALIGPLTTLTRVAEPQQPAAGAEMNGTAPTEENTAASVSANVQPGPASSYPGRPSFDCASARSQSEITVCSDAGLSALDVNMATQYRRALATATPEQRALLQRTRDRFLGYRERCANRQCIGDAYVGRMREIRDIMAGRL
ncbi:lysozyme inhibitor LprI family protein [Sphingomonas sp. URHD0057]|uniref:lysozyme inhibitor LprI family protein n=1 Tax=Sphingomonas sp. URHD0057 TaxID=1380389 RepID=UPI0012DE2CFC|nr:hypothetical protein [Sphingomonas sp. URHD0057]